MFKSFISDYFQVHTVFGVVLMSAGVARIIEITFVLKDGASISDDPTRPVAQPVEIHAFQHLPPFVSVPWIYLESTLIDPPGHSYLSPEGGYFITFLIWTDR